MVNAIVLALALVPVVHASWDLPPRARGGLAFQQQQLLKLGNTDAKYWDAPQDHQDASKGTYQQKYYVDDSQWDGSGPIFLEIGGEGPVGSSPTGWIAELAATHSALAVQLEHRFYGESVPNGNVDTDNLKLLTVDQALADAAGFIEHLSAELNATDNPWVAFGGSYPGALSAWFRVAYPDSTVGSLSSSGVVNAILKFPEFDERVSAAIGDSCADVVRATTAAFERATNSTLGEDAGARAKALFGCDEGMWDPDFFYMLADSAAMADQYSAKSALCAALQPSDDDWTLMTQFANFTNAFWGADFGSQCFYDTRCLADPDQYEVGATDRSWRWQKCYELAYFQVAPETDSLRSQLVDFAYHEEQCARAFGQDFAPSTDAINDKFGGAQIDVANVFFSDFSDDPWREASVTSDPVNPSSTFFLVECDDCGHCMDFHTPSDSDPDELKAERAAFEAQLNQWLA